MMWKDRLPRSPSNLPSAQPPSRPRSQSPALQNPSLLGPSVSGLRPDVGLRSSSLSLISNDSTAPVVVPTKPSSHGSSTRTRPLPRQSNLPVNTAEPLEMLDHVLSSLTARPTEKGQSATTLKPLGGSRGLSAADTVRDDDDRSQISQGGLTDLNQSDRLRKERYETLHQSVAGCDDVLCSVQQYLSNFQSDLGAISMEIEKLQTRSTTLNIRLGNRQAVEVILGPAVEQFTISPGTIRKIAEGTMDEEWIVAMVDVQNRVEFVEAATTGEEHVRALDDLKPLYTDMINKALERIRDHLVASIKGLRSPNVNAQMIQQASFLRFKDLYKFLRQHHPKLADEIVQAYIHTMRWYYRSNFTRYSQALEKLKVHVMDKYDVLGHLDPSRRVATNKDVPPHEAFSIGNRKGLLNFTRQGGAISSYLAEETSLSHYLEVPFYNFNLALIDNATTEYSFLTEFLSPHPFHFVSRTFLEIFEPTFDVGLRLTKLLIEANLDCLGLLLCVRLNQQFAFELQRRKMPSLESYINGTNMLLWPRFQMIMDTHCESIRRATTSLSGRASATLSLIGTDPSKSSTAPHFITQRFGLLLQGALILSDEAGDDEPVSSSLGRLRTEFESFLIKFSKTTVADARKRQRLLFNNYSLILTIISDTTGKLAEEQKAHFGTMKSSLNT